MEFNFKIEDWQESENGFELTFSKSVNGRHIWHSFLVHNDGTAEQIVTEIKDFPDRVVIAVNRKFDGYIVGR